MAFSRLFGKGKKEPPSPSGSQNSPDLSEREGDDNFTLVDQKPMNPQPNADLPPTYQSVNQLPYQLLTRMPGGSPATAAGSGGGVGPPTLQKQISHPLEGVVFHLSPKLATDSELDQLTSTVDNVMSRIKNIEWAAFDYDLSLEKSVLSSEISLDSVSIK